MYMYIYIYIYIYTHTHTHIYIYIYIYVQQKNREIAYVFTFFGKKTFMALYFCRCFSSSLQIFWVKKHPNLIAFNVS